MARSQKPPQPGPPQFPAVRAANLLNQHIDRGRAILSSRPASPLTRDVHDHWETVGTKLLEGAFGIGSEEATRGLFVPVSTRIGQAESYYEGKRAEELTSQISRLSGYVAVLEILASEAPASLSEPMPAPHVPPKAAHSNRVFVVHGRDERYKHEVARLLTDLQLEPIVLHEQPNGGRTIIEKFEQHADVRFAVVLLTADDVGGLRSSAPQELQQRPRQNVVLELGYFLAKLGRRNVAALVAPGVELPSDYHGVVYTPLDPGSSWKYAVARELRDAGLHVDLNKVR